MDNPLNPPPPPKFSGFLEASKYSADQAFKNAIGPQYNTLPPEKAFEFAFCMGAVYGLTSGSVIAKNFLMADPQNLIPQEELLQYQTIAQYLSEVLKKTAST